MSVQTITDFYEVNDSADKVHLEVKFGYGQPASSLIFINQVPLGGAMKNDFEMDIDSNSVLKNKKLTINSSVWDLQTATDQTSVTIKLTGGNKPYERTAQISVSEKGGVAVYVTTIYFM